MVLYLRLPNQRASRGIYGICIGAHITKKHGELVCPGDRCKTDGRSDERLRFERPAGASAFCVKRVDLTIAAADKDHAADNGWLGQRARYTEKSERPFQLQLGELLGRQSRHCCWLEAAVVKISPPSIPPRPVEPLGKPDRVVTALSGNI